MIYKVPSNSNPSMIFYERTPASKRRKKIKLKDIRILVWLCSFKCCAGREQVTKELKTKGFCISMSVLKSE